MTEFRSQLIFFPDDLIIDQIDELIELLVPTQIQLFTLEITEPFINSSCFECGYVNNPEGLIRKCHELLLLPNI